VHEAPLSPSGPPPSPRRAGGASPVALLVVGALLGGAIGGVVGATLSGRVEGLLPARTAAPGETRQITIQESSLLVDSVKTVLPAVVTVVQKGPGGEVRSSGSGVVVDKDRGFVVTNSHVVEQPRTTTPAQNVDVILFDGKRHSATVVGNDPFTDVAVLRVGTALPAQATLGDTAQVPLGAQVVAIGSPGSAVGIFQNTVTSGIVSAKGRRLPRTDLRDIFLEDLLQTDAAINPGNSGGPLVWAATKEVIGLNALVVRPAGEEGLGFAISSETVRRISDEIIAEGRVVRGFIGISYDDNNPQYAAYYGLPTSDGVVVLEVRPGTPAAAAGIQPRDVITKMNGQVIDQAHPLKTLLLNTRPGDRVTLTILRGAREQTVPLTLGQPVSGLDAA
jgi:S1-C subfamily serine protease